MRPRRMGLNLFQAEGSFADLFRKCAGSVVNLLDC